MEFKNYDVAFITDEKERLYFLGFHSTAGYVVISRDKTCFSVDGRYFSAAEKALKGKGIEVSLGGDYKTFFKEAEDLGIKRIGIDFTATTVSDLETYKKSCDCEFVDISDELIKIMTVKSNEEINNLQVACRIAEKAWKDTLGFIKEGITERQLANELEYNFKKYGASGTSFDTIVAFGKNAAVPHHETGDAKLRANQCVLMDFGCLYKGYCSDMTRTMFFGVPDKEFLDAYDAVFTAHKKVAETIVSGTCGKDADKTARDVLEQRGYGKYFTHSLGHGIGVHIHEYPTLSPRSEWVIENNMVFSNEPGVYIDGKFGIRIEDSAYLSDGKYKSFMKDDKRLIVISDGQIKKLK